MDLDPENQAAVDLYWRIRRLGAELVFALSPLRLTEFEAEELLDRLAVIAEWIEADEQQKEHERMRQLLQKGG